MKQPEGPYAITVPEVDIKQISKRAYQLGIIAIITGCIIGCFYMNMGLVKSAYADYLFSVALATILVLHHYNVVRNIQFFLILTVDIFLTGVSVIEGSGTGHFLYFFPLMVAIPSIIDLKQLGKRNILSYYGISILALGLTLLVGFTITPIEVISPAMYHQVFLTNLCASFVLTIIFSGICVHFEYQFRKRLEAEQEKVIASRTRFLSTMGHELRTPLNGIIGAINVLKEEAQLDENNEFVQILKYCSDHMLKQVNDVLDFNKIEAGKLDIRPVKVNIQHLMANVAIPHANHFEQKGLSLKVNIDPNLNTWVMADDIRLVQILNNLLSNALKYTNKGRVDLEATVKEQLEDFVTVEFAVQDTGMGIADEDRSRIFDGFWQVYNPNTRYINGTGLGLSICVRLLEMMHSSLELETEEKKGSRFYFSVTFKTLKQHDHPILPDGDIRQNDLSGLRVLIVEDNPINMMIAKKALTSLKAEINTAIHGQQALDMLLVDAQYDAILLDLEMPVLNGYDTIAPLKARHPHIPVLAFTASLVDQEMLSQLLTSGFTDVILKPFQSHQLLLQIQNAIHPDVIAE